MCIEGLVGRNGGRQERRRCACLLGRRTAGATGTRELITSTERSATSPGHSRWPQHASSRPHHLSAWNQCHHCSHSESQTQTSTTEGRASSARWSATMQSSTSSSPSQAAGRPPRRPLRSAFTRRPGTRSGASDSVGRAAPQSFCPRSILQRRCVLPLDRPQSPRSRLHRVASRLDRARSGGIMIISRRQAPGATPSTGCSCMTQPRPRGHVPGMARVSPAARRRDDTGAAKNVPTPSKEAEHLKAQGEKMRAKATKAVAARQMLQACRGIVRAGGRQTVNEKVARLRFPEPLPVAAFHTDAEALSKSQVARGVHRRRPGDRPRFQGRRPGA